jgi:hydroxyacylglutathione hydrolase
MDVRMFTVGPVQENCFLFRQDGSDRALIVDPGEEEAKLLGAIEALGVTLEAILLTHTHFDHVGAVAPVAKATGAPVYCPKLEVPVLQDIMAFVPWEGFGPSRPATAPAT